jgi:hypothetical protein
MPKRVYEPCLPRREAGSDSPVASSQSSAILKGTHMPQAKVLPIDEVLGWKLSDDGAHVMLGLKLSDGSELPLAFPPKKLVPAITSLAHASGAIPTPNGVDAQGELAIEANSFEVGKDEASGDFFVRFGLLGGGQLTFVMGKSMAEGLAEALNARRWASPKASLPAER